MATDRLRLGDRARNKLIALSDKADIEPTFLLEYLINCHGDEAIQRITGGENKLVTQTDTSQQTKPLPVAASVPTEPNKTDFASLIANA